MEMIMYVLFTVKFLWEYQVKITSEMYIVENGINWSISILLIEHLQCARFYSYELQSLLGGF